MYECVPFHMRVTSFYGVAQFIDFIYNIHTSIQIFSRVNIRQLFFFVSSLCGLLMYVQQRNELSRFSLLHSKYCVRELKHLVAIIWWWWWPTFMHIIILTNSIIPSIDRGSREYVQAVV